MTRAGEVQTLRPAEMGIAYRQCAACARPLPSARCCGRRRRGGGGNRPPDRHLSQPAARDATARTERGLRVQKSANGSAGRLIDECGLKGARVGGAEVSPRHANFIVNLGTATAGDVLELVRRIRTRVRQLKGVDLEPEVLLFGKDWKDVL